MTVLRERLIEDMQVRNYSPRTVEAYVAAVAKLAKHFMRAPDQLTSEELRAFQVHLLSAKASWSQFNQIVCGLRFFYRTTLGRAEVVAMLPYGKKPKTLPAVLSMEEVGQLLAAAKPGRERMLLETAYGCRRTLSCAGPGAHRQRCRPATSRKRRFAASSLERSACRPAYAVRAASKIGLARLLFTARQQPQNLSKRSKFVDRRSNHRVNSIRRGIPAP